jgi:hypothetical protein
MAWPYARYLFSESLAGLGLMASFYFLLPPAGQEGDGLGEEWHPLLLLAGAGLGLALLARLNNALVAPLLGLLLLAYLYRRHGRDWGAYVAPLLLFGLPVLAALGASGWYNWLRFGSPLTTGYLPEERFATPFFEGFYGLILSPGKGLLWYDPIFFAALAGWPALFRRHRAEALLIASVVLANVAFYAPWYLWWAGHAWGPRFLVTILPFASLPLAPVLAAARKRRVLALGLLGLALISLAVQLLGVAVDFNRYLEEIHAELGLYHPATLFHPAYSPLLRQWAYLRPENLDLAWAAGGTMDWGVLAGGLILVGLCGVALWTAWRGRLGAVLAGLLLLPLAIGVFVSLVAAFPENKVTTASLFLERAAFRTGVEDPHQIGLLAEPLTEAFQNAYDGELWVWGRSLDSTDLPAVAGSVWTVGLEGIEAPPADARFQIGPVRIDYYPAIGLQFYDEWIVGNPRPQPPHIGSLARLVATYLPFGGLDGAQVRPGEALTIGLYWRALDPTDTSYTLFVQVLDEAGAKIGQVDRLPCLGGCPTTTWQPGDLIGEWIPIPIQADAPPGRYQIIAGMYDLATGQNLPVLDIAGRPIGDYVEVGSVWVGP